MFIDVDATLQDSTLFGSVGGKFVISCEDIKLVSF